MRVTFLPLELNRAVMILGDTGAHLIKAFAHHKSHSLRLCVLFVIVSRVNQQFSCCWCYATSSIPSAFTDFQHHNVITAHFVCHLCGFTCLVHSADVPGPYPCCGLHRQKRYWPSGSRQGFTRRCHVTLRGGLFASRADPAQYCFRFCNQFHPLVGDWPSQLQQGPH